MSYIASVGNDFVSANLCSPNINVDVIIENSNQSYGRYIKICL